MGCISYSTSRIGGMSMSALHNPVFCYQTVSNDVFDFYVNANDAFDISCSRKESIGFACGLVCSVNYALQLKVEPKHIWLMPSNMFTDSVVITTSVEWHIEK